MRNGFEKALTDYKTKQEEERIAKFRDLMRKPINKRASTPGSTRKKKRRKKYKRHKTYDFATIGIKEVVKEEIIEEEAEEYEEEIEGYVSPVESRRRAWRKYRDLTWEITRTQKIHRLKGYKERASKGMHLDHKVSIWYGYKNMVDPKLIGSINNLEYIPWRDNLRKGTRCNFAGFKGMQTVLFIG